MDFSQGREMIHIRAINTRDNDVPQQFEYVSDMIYLDWFSLVLRKGCDCSHECLNLRKCACVVINGEISYNHYGAIIKSPLSLSVVLLAGALLLARIEDLPPKEELGIKFSIPRLVLEILMFKGLYSKEDDDQEDDNEFKELEDELDD
ncbi:hypothetical protein SLEP1_g22108 [Rubroshorea leprosula]|uniref:Pre-SET domain-containing protein n=1 Tax=Rubroshorea leprosula TaxID=152421 RepID=A0AAV5JK72_9ROSI|nr:hypothetical protein SLEP1_g22108 [Rubroshorea leprosula]